MPRHYKPNIVEKEGPPSRGFTKLEAFIAMTMLIALAFLAVPVLKKIQNQTHLDQVYNNLQTIILAGQQYNLENGTPHVPFTDLEGYYFNVITPVAQEDYSNIIIYDHGGTIKITVANQEVSYQYR